ncbi:hypothetical protein V565_331160, partial [Rhizoctonia solani 123E]
MKIDKELEGLEYTQVLDDSPPLSGSVVQLSSDSEPEILDIPDSPPRQRAPTTASTIRQPRHQSARQPAHQSVPSAEFHVVAQKVQAQSRPAQPAQPCNPLDAATAQLASVLNPSADNDQVN